MHVCVYDCSLACIEGLSELGKLPKRHVLVDSDDSSDVEEVLPLSERVGLHCMQPSKKGTDVPSTRKEVTSGHKDVTSVHKDVTSVHKDVPSVHKDVVHKDVPSQIGVHAAGNPVDNPLCISPLRSNKVPLPPFEWKPQILFFFIGHGPTHTSTGGWTDPQPKSWTSCY